MNIYKNRRRTWMKAIAMALVCLLFVNLNLHYCVASDFPFKHKLSAWSHIDDPVFREIYMMSALCRFIEREGKLGDDSDYHDINRIRHEVEYSPDFRNVKIYRSCNEIIFDVPDEGLSLRYFDPRHESIVTPFANVLDVRTRTFSDRLWCQAITREKIAARKSRASGEYQFLVNADYRNILINSILKIAHEARKKKIETIFACGYSAKPTAQLLAMVWEKIYPDVPVPRIEYLEHTGQVQIDLYKTKEVKRELEAIEGLPEILSKPILLLDDTSATGQTLRKTKGIFKQKFKAKKVFAAAMIILIRGLPRMYEDDDDWDPKYRIEICGETIFEWDEAIFEENSWYSVRSWIRSGRKNKGFKKRFKQTKKQMRKIFEEYLPHDFQMLSREAQRVYINRTTEKVKGDAPKQPMYIRPPPVRFVERNKEVMDTVAQDKDEPLVLRFPVERLEHYTSDEMIEFLNTFQSAPGAYVKLYTMSGVGDVGRDMYNSYGIEYKEMPEDVKKRFVASRSNTITLLAAERGEELTDTDLRLRLGSVKIRPEDTILVPFGIENDNAGIIRGTVVGLRLVELAKRLGKERNVTDGDRDYIRSKILEPYKDICDIADIPDFDITSDDIVNLVFGTENTIRKALNKLIRLLPAEPMDAEELKLMHELATRVLQAA